MVALGTKLAVLGVGVRSALGGPGASLRAVVGSLESGLVESGIGSLLALSLLVGVSERGASSRAVVVATGIGIETLLGRPSTSPEGRFGVVTARAGTGVLPLARPSSDIRGWEPVVPDR